jgi:hypothetical protein
VETLSFCDICNGFTGKLSLINKKVQEVEFIFREWNGYN